MFSGTVEPYNFVFHHDYDYRGVEDAGDYVEDMIQLQEDIEEMPETQQTFTASHLSMDSVRFAQVPPRFLNIIGSWRVPDRFTSTGGRRFVNPNAKHVSYFADVGVECACGRFFTEQRYVYGIENIVHSAHGDCTAEEREAARERFKRNRMQWITLAANLWLSSEETARRMDLHSSSVPKVAADAGVDWGELYKIGRLRTVETWKVLRESGYSMREIAEAWGIPASSVRARISERNNNTLTEQRRQGGVG